MNSIRKPSKTTTSNSSYERLERVISISQIGDAFISPRRKMSLSRAFLRRRAIGTSLAASRRAALRATATSLISGKYEDEFHELNYYNGRGASSRELYDSQHSRIVPLASRLLGLSFPPPPAARATRASRRGTRHVAIIHTLCTD